MNQNPDPNRNPNPSINPDDNQTRPPAENFGKRIGDTVRDALQSGDFSRLKDIGPAVQDVVKQATTNISINTGGQTPPPPPAKPAGYSGLRPATPQSGFKLQKTARRKTSFAGLPSIVFGTMGVVAFGLASITMGVLGITGAVGTVGPILAGVFFGVTVLSTALLGVGASKRALGNRVQRYYELLDAKTVVQLPELAAAVNSTPAKVKKDLRTAMRKNMMPDVRMDAAETCAMVGQDAYQMYLNAEKTRQEREAEEARLEQLLQDPDAAAMERFKKEGKQALEKIRAANAAIPGEEISGKIDQLEFTAAKIFAYVKKHPEKLPDTRRFMDYYLPTTLKLLDKYRQYEEMEVSLPNVEKTKKEIDSSLDTINAAFNNLLGSLYQDDTLDVSTDIEVLQTVLRQEGLAGRRFDIKTDEAMNSYFEEENE